MASSERDSVTEMIDRARQGDVDAQVQLWERYRKLLYAMARDGSDDDLRSGATDTSDIVAEVGLRFFTADLLANIQDRHHFKNWLRQLVRGKKIDLARREAARPAVPLADDSGAAPSGPGLQDFVLVDLRDLINALPLTLHEAALAYMELGNERDAAAALKITRDEFRNRMASIRVLWSQSLGED